MFENSQELQVYKSFNKGIANTVCAFLNTNGGQIICLKNGKLFNSRDEVVSYSNRVKNLLTDNISNYPRNIIEYRIVEIEDKYLLDLIIKKSNQYHKVDNTRNYYIRSGKETKIFDVGLNFGIRPKTEYWDGYYKIGDFATGNKFHKYMSLENALQCLKGGNIWFVEPSKWQDKYEAYFYKAKIFGKTCSENNPIVYATCVTNRRESESAWKIYAYNTQGLASRCVEFILNRKKLRECLINSKYSLDGREYDLKSDYYIFEGTVIYKDELVIRELSKPQIARNNSPITNEMHNAYFQDFSFEKYLNLLLLKRNAFEHEHETRIFVVKKNFHNMSEKSDGHIDIKINWKEILEGVIYDTNCSDFEIKLLEDEVKKVLNLNSSDPFPDGFIFKDYNVYNGPNPASIEIL